MRRVLIPAHVPTLAPLAPRAAQVVLGPVDTGVASLRGETMGTTWSVKAVTRIADDQLRPLIERCLSLVVAPMSQWESGSALSRFYKAPAGSWHELPAEFAAVLHYALSLARDTEGAYDPTLGALTELWGFGASGRRGNVPDVEAIEAARACGGWQRVTFDRTRRAALQPGSVRLDLSSVAKGFAVDLVSETLAWRGITDHLVEIGGELRGSGGKPDRTPWWVAIEEASDLVIALHGLSIATSGDARRFIEQDGRKLSHTIDPRNGLPIAEDLAAVTVLNASCMKADALATALSVLGADEGMRFARERGIAARFVVRGAGGPIERMSPAFAEMLD
ncbi:MAG: FAD:protein FMN transferase [Pseudorhodoplanes sp.]